LTQTTVNALLRHFEQNDEAERSDDNLSAFRDKDKVVFQSMHIWTTVLHEIFLF